MNRAVLGIFLSMTVLGCSSTPSTPATPAPAPLTLQVAGNAGLTQKGGTAQLTAFVAFSDGTTADEAASASWVSDKPGVAIVGRTGMVTAVEDGSSVITATFQNIAGFTTVIVDLSKAPATP